MLIAFSSSHPYLLFLNLILNSFFFTSSSPFLIFLISSSPNSGLYLIFFRTPFYPLPKSLSSANHLLFIFFFPPPHLPYAGFLLAPAEGFGFRLRVFFYPLGKKRAFCAAFAYFSPFWVFLPKIQKKSKNIKNI